MIILTKLDDPQVKMALMAISDMSATIRLKSHDFSLKLGNPQSQMLVNNQRATEQILASFYCKAGLDIDKLEEIRNQSQSEINKIFEKREAEAIAKSTSIKKSIRADVNKRIKNLTRIPYPPVPGSLAPYYIVHSPLFIGRTLGIVLTDWNNEPDNSWAKITFDDEIGGYYGSNELKSLYFWFIWENPSNNWAVISAFCPLSVNGYVKVTAKGGLLPETISGNRTCSLDVSASMQVYEWWDAKDYPNNTPKQEPSQSKDIASLDAESGGWYSPDDSNDTYIGAEYDLSYEVLAVPPNGMVVFMIGLSLYFEAQGDGKVHVDFSNEGFEVFCPWIYISVLNSISVGPGPRPEV